MSEDVPLASTREPGSTIAFTRPKRSRLARLLADSDLDWRAEICTRLLVRGWTKIRVEGDVVTAEA